MLERQAWHIFRLLIFLFWTRFSICIFIFFYLYIFILEMLGKLLLSLWNSHFAVKIGWHATPLTTWRTKRSKIWIFLFILFPHLFMPSHFLNKKQGQELKQNNWKYLRDLTWTRPVKKTLVDFLNASFASSFFFFFYNLFSLMARIRIATVLRGYQYNYIETVPIGKANHHLFYLFIHSYVKGYRFLEGSLLGQRTYLVGKKCLYCVRNHK